MRPPGRRPRGGVRHELSRPVLCGQDATQLVYARGEGRSDLRHGACPAAEMNSIFLSYTHEDRDTARSLADALEGRGWAVWWDRHIRPGESFGKAIQKQIDDAMCVIVLWSGSSVTSEWVEAESARAKQAKKLVPVLIEPVADRIPLEFSRLSALDLVGWRGEPEHAGFSGLLSEIGRRRTEARVPAEGPERDPDAPRPAKELRGSPALTQRARTLVTLNLSGLLGLLALVWLISQRAFRLREGDPTFERYHGEMILVIAGVCLLCLVLVAMGMALGAEGQRLRLRPLVALGWILTPLSAATFFYHMFIGNRGSSGELFTIPYSRYYSQFIRAFQGELLIVLAAAAVGVWALTRHRRKT